MPWCGTQFVPPGTTTCPNGQPPTSQMAGNAPAKTPDGKPVSTIPSGPPKRENPFSVAGPTAVPWGSQYSSPRPTKQWYTSQTAAEETGYANIDSVFGDGAGAWVDSIAKKIDYRSTGSSLWRKAIAAISDKNAPQSGMTPMQWIEQYARQKGVVLSAGEDPTGGSGPGGGGSGSGGGGGYSGPKTSVSYDPAAKPDVRAIADGVAQEMLGRVVTDDELQRIMKRVRKYEEANPSVRVSDSQPGSNVSRTTAPGATNAGRQEIVEKLLAKNPDFVPYQMNHTVYDAMLGVMQRGQEIANG